MNVMQTKTETPLFSARYPKSVKSYRKWGGDRLKVRIR